MSSADFSKIKTPQEAKAKIRHDDELERLKHDHTNKTIDKFLTQNNLSFYGRSYEDVCSRYDAIISECDAQPNANKRKDRVTNVCIEIPTPDNLKPQDEAKFFKRAGEELCKIYGEDTLLEGYFHVDEKHEYYDVETHGLKMSRNHATFRFMPVVDDSLNAKSFTCRKNIFRVNHALAMMCQTEFGIDFNNGKGKRGRSVEELKNESTAAVKQINANLLKKERFLNGRESALDVREAELNAKDASLSDREGTLDVKEDLYRQTLADDAKQSLKATESALKADLQSKMDAIIDRRVEEKFQKRCQHADDAERLTSNISKHPDRRMPNMPSM